jgi:hypothetical protein
MMTLMLSVLDEVVDGMSISFAGVSGHKWQALQSACVQSADCVPAFSNAAALEVPVMHCPMPRHVSPWMQVALLP